MRALFIGRFQPFHLGHLNAIKAIAGAGADQIIIAIGSAQYSGTVDNPYDLKTRQAMIESALKNEKISYQLCAIPDIHDETRWVEYLINITGPIDVIYTGNPVVAKLFRDKNYIVKPVEMKIKISGTELRRMIADKNEEWKNLVPDNVVEILTTPKLLLVRNINI